MFFSSPIVTQSINTEEPFLNSQRCMIMHVIGITLGKRAYPLKKLTFYEYLPCKL